MTKGIFDTVKKNGRTVFGVVTGLAIAGASLMAARKADRSEIEDGIEIVEWDEIEEEVTEGSAEENGEE